MAQDSWRQTVEDHYDICRMRAMSRACEVISRLPIERVLTKFDVGAVEHQGNDISRLNPVAEFENEMCDAISYEALILSKGLDE